MIITHVSNNKKMNLEFIKEYEDARGKILFLKYGNKDVNLIEIKKGFARGGHFHQKETSHFLVSGTIEYHEENIKTKIEKISIISSPNIIHVPPNEAHLLIAKKDSLFFEVFENYEDTVYPKFRKIVEDLMK